MLKKGDVISYGTTGVCKVEGECEQTVKGQKKRYIVLKPVHQINSTLYVPVDNDELKTKFKPLLTGDEIEEIIKKGGELSEIVDELVERANQNGGKDNIAVILIEPLTDEVGEC